MAFPPFHFRVHHCKCLREMRGISGVQNRGKNPDISPQCKPSSLQHYCHSTAETTSAKGSSNVSAQFQALVFLLNALILPIRSNYSWSAIFSLFANITMTIQYYIQWALQMEV